MIREAIEKRDDLALGYRSPGEYVADRFGGALTRLGVKVRREVVRELTAAGMSTRAIGPVVGVSNKTVSIDLRSPVTEVTPAVDRTTGEILAPIDFPVEDVAASDAGEEPGAGVEPSPSAAPPRPITGLDGKTYTRPAPKAAPRRDLTKQFFDAAYDLTKQVERIHRLTEDDRFPQNAEKVAAKHRNDLLRCQDLLQQVLDRLT